MKHLSGLGRMIAQSNAWKKFANPTAGRGQTAWPKNKAELESIGVRFDYDGEVTRNGVAYHKFQCQPNAGKVPSSVKAWREANGGTHAVMASILVKKGATKEEVQSAVDAGMKSING